MSDTPMAVRRARRMTSTRTVVVGGVLLAAAVTLGLGLVGPCMTIVPDAGKFTGWVRVFSPEELEPTTYSILSGIDAMRRSGSVGLASLLFGFSVAFPVLKLGAVAWGTAALALGVRPHAAVWLAHHLGKFSMLDVVVVGLLVLAVKGLPGGSEVQLGWGVWLFATSVGLSLVASVVLHGVRPAR